MYRWVLGVGGFPSMSLKAHMRAVDYKSPRTGEVSIDTIARHVHG